MVVEGCNHFEMVAGVEHFVHLLQKRLPIKLCGGDESVLTEEDVFAFQSCIEILVEQVKRLFFTAIENKFDGIL